MYSIMIVDDHPIVREGLRMVINMDDSLQVVATAENGEDALKKLKKLNTLPDLILIDILMPKANGETLISKLAGKTRLVILSTEVNLRIAQSALAIGVQGYLLKDEDPLEIVKQLKKVLNDSSYLAISSEVSTAIIKSKKKSSFNLTKQQVRILEMVAEGLTNKEIAEDIHVTVRTVKNYLTVIYSILQVNNRAQAIAVSVKNGLI